MGEKDGQLKKELGVFDAMSIIGGIMIGSGVFYVGSFVIERTAYPLAGNCRMDLCGSLFIDGRIMLCGIRGGYA